MVTGDSGDAGKDYWVNELSVCGRGFYSQVVGYSNSHAKCLLTNLLKKAKLYFIITNETLAKLLNSSYRLSSTKANARLYSTKLTAQLTKFCIPTRVLHTRLGLQHTNYSYPTRRTDMCEIRWEW